jgi:hypothetical protein
MRYIVVIFPLLALVETTRTWCREKEGLKTT